MIEGKYRYKGEEDYNYKDFKSEEEMMKFLEDDPKEVDEYEFREKKINNPLKNWFNNLKNTKKNWAKVKGSPYASLAFQLKARKLIVALLIPFIAWRIFDMVINFRGSGAMGIITQLFMVSVGVAVCWKVYATIPQQKKMIEYYKKYPHTINYVPTNTKETVDDILEKIKSNKIKSEEVKNNGITGKGEKEKRRKS